MPSSSVAAVCDRRITYSLAAVTDRRYSKKPDRALAIIIRDRVPIHHVPPSFDVVGPTVLVIEIISVFPNIHSEDRGVSFHERAVLVRSGYDFKFPTFVLNQPRPTAAEATHPSCSELLLKALKLPKVDLMSSASLPVGSPPVFRPMIFQ